MYAGCSRGTVVALKLTGRKGVGWDVGQWVRENLSYKLRQNFWRIDGGAKKTKPELDLKRAG